MNTGDPIDDCWECRGMGELYDNHSYFGATECPRYEGTGLSFKARMTRLREEEREERTP